VATIDTGSVCNIQGKIDLTDTVLCRDLSIADDGQSGTSCNITGNSALFSVNIGRTSLCAEDPINTAAHQTYTLKTFFDREFKTPQDVFQTGDMIYFQFDITNPDTTIDEITFNQIKIQAGIWASHVRDVVYSVAEPRGAGTYTHDIDFALINEVKQPVSPGQTATLQFGFRLLRSKLDVVREYVTLGSDGPKSISAKVTVDLLYHGNQKRTVDLSHDITTTTISEEVQLTLVVGSELGVDANADADADFDGEAGLFSGATSTSSISFFAPLLCALFVLFVTRR